MASARRILRTEGPIALIEERIFFVEPALTLHVVYSVTGDRAENASFDDLGWAQKYFDAEVARRRSPSH